VSTDTATIQKWFDAHVDDDDKEIAIKRIARRFRSGTRQSRMSVAEEAQEPFERKVWGKSRQAKTPTCSPT